MNDLDTLIAEAEALERSTREELLAAGEDEDRLAKLAGELGAVNKPTEEERARFWFVYGTLMDWMSAAVTKSEFACSAFGMATQSRALGWDAYATSWSYDHRESMVRWHDDPVLVIGFCSQQVFTVAVSSENLLSHLDRELRVAAAEIVERAYGECPLAMAVVTGACSYKIDYQGWHAKIDRYIDPEAHIAPERLRLAVFNAARGASLDQIHEASLGGRHASEDEPSQVRH
jgi:hypothetical protein